MMSDLAGAVADLMGPSTASGRRLGASRSTAQGDPAGHGEGLVAAVQVEAVRRVNLCCDSALLGEVAGGFPEDPTWPDRLLDVLFLLREHILKEQDGVFPAALAALDTNQWEHIEAMRAQARSSR